MRFLLILILLLCACAKKQEEKSIAAISAVAPEEAFKNTPQHSTGSLLARAAINLRKGISLSALDAERCLKAESARSQVADVCALLWATGKDDSASTGAFLAARAELSDSAAVGLILKPENLKGLGAEKLATILARLEKRPLLHRIHLAQAWIIQNRTFSQAELLLVLPQLAHSRRPTEGDVKAKFHFLYAQSEVDFKNEISKYCRSDVYQSARERCWRLIGVLADETAPAGLISQFAAFFPEQNTPQWLSFSRTHSRLSARLNSVMTRN